jgi:hypothetical protein
MRTSHPINPDRAVAGMALSGYKSVSKLLPLVAQVQTATLTDAVAGDLVITMRDDDVSLSRSLTVTLTTTNVATSLDEIVSAWQADPTFSDLATVSEDGATVLTVTSKIKGKTYTLTFEEPGAMVAIAVAQTVAPIDAKGVGVEFGRFVKYAAADGEIATLEAGDTVSDLAGLIRRTEGNHFHKLEESLSDVDATVRGTHYPVMEHGRMWVYVEDAVTPASTPHVRISGSGEIGALRGTPAGGQQSYTFTPSAINLPGYGFEFDYQGVHYTALYLGDGSTTVAQACDGLVQDLGSISGLTITDGATEVTIQTAAGTRLENVRNLASHTDVPVNSVTIAESVAADLDSIDASSICRFETSASAGGLALLKVSVSP